MVSTETFGSLSKTAALNKSERKSTEVSGVREEEPAVICITRDASLSGEPPEQSSIGREEA